MLPGSYSLRCLLIFLFVFILQCEGAFVRRSPCETSVLNRSSAVNLHIDSIHGYIHSSQGASTLSLTLLGFYNASQVTCTDVQLTEEHDLRFRVLGYPVGRLDRIQKLCYSPPALWRLPESLQVSKWELTYSLAYGRPLQTLAGEFEFSLRNGTNIGCTAARITPDIGAASSAAFTYLPAAIILLVGMASWCRHTQQRRRSVPEHGTAPTPQDSVRKIVVDVADYVRYLQFIFLTGSLTMQYPGFFQPIVSQLAWSSLLFWSGPIDHGFRYPGIEDGIYSTNGTCGLEYMAQNLGFPSMLDIMFDALINLCIVVSAIVVILLVGWLLKSGSRHGVSLDTVLVQIPEACHSIVGVTLLFFSLPLLAYLAYPFVLVAELPSYRICLMVLMIGVLVGSNLFVARYQTKQKPRRSDHNSSKASPRFDTAMEYIAHYLLYCLPLMQGLAIGGLQLWGWVQLLLLGGCELIILAHLILQRRTKFMLSKSAWCTAVRLLTLILSVAFVCPSREVTRQWIGYFILVLHGVVVVFGFLFISVWHIGRFAIKGFDRRVADDRWVGSSKVPHLNLADLSSPSDKRRNLDGKDLEVNSFDSISDRYRPGSSRRIYRGFESCPDMPNSPNLPEATAPYSPNTSTFYRPPRSLNARVASYEYENTNPDSISSVFESSESPQTDSSSSQHSSDAFDELLQLPRKSGIDYSFRESDLYYGSRRGESGPSQESSNESPDEGQSSRQTFLNWKRSSTERFKQKKTKEKGFQVMRPPRPM
ncbi:uncharacterized protein NFIA_092880 [Aspergillus fischeri NRRL 181]|uniref:Integral membrane protein n=1 Tax=Neosartorya fischeri (strain ATCC 1020 / DSM 3700 / CBS 544.65 / FGSC A1164 / JCM 1740 / NRRL 181 / WB 181) TaxID=331117 RepID=A1DIX0_NEOFI|nr:conserved hypothetical protein [Aspergillus fischeri NRRL 181]EAW19327.1 conserved hypothetical protein [Aspergillus fischeri NRRL 181]